VKQRDLISKASNLTVKGFYNSNIICLPLSITLYLVPCIQMALKAIIKLKVPKHRGAIVMSNECYVVNGTETRNQLIREAESQVGNR